MTADLDVDLSWIRVGGVCGILSIAAYASAAFLPLPDVLGYAAAFAFGPLLAVGASGLYRCLALHRRGPLIQIAVVSAIAGGVTLLIMLSTQQAIFAVMKGASVQAGDPRDARLHQQMAEGLNAVHFGMDVAWDVLISVAVILFGLGMIRHPRFGKVIGTAGVVLGALLLGFNLWHFPIPPASEGSIDWGPFVALWMLATFILLLRAGKWAREMQGRRGTPPA